MRPGEERPKDNTSNSLQPLSENQCQVGWRQQHPAPTGQVSGNVFPNICKGKVKDI